MVTVWLLASVELIYGVDKRGQIVFENGAGVVPQSQEEKFKPTKHTESNTGDVAHDDKEDTTENTGK